MAEGANNFDLIRLLDPEMIAQAANNAYADYAQRTAESGQTAEGYGSAETHIGAGTLRAAAMYDNGEVRINLSVDPDAA